MIERTIVGLLKSESGDVIKVTVEYVLKDGEHVAKLTSTHSLYPADSVDYIPYEDLTMEDVMSWLPFDSNMEIYLTDILEELKNETVSPEEFPWTSKQTITTSA